MLKIQLGAEGNQFFMSSSRGCMEDQFLYLYHNNEPIINSEDIPKLVLNKENIFKNITKKELDAIVEQVNL